MDINLPENPFNQGAAIGVQEFQAGTDWAAKKAGLALQQQQIQNQQAQTQLMRDQFQFKLGSQMKSDLMDIVPMQNGKLKDQLLQNFQDKYTKAGFPVDDSWIAAAKDPEYSQKLAEGMSELDNQLGMGTTPEAYQKVLGLLPGAMASEVTAKHLEEAPQLFRTMQMMAMMNQRMGLQMGNLNERQNQNATKAGLAFDNDAIIKMGTKTMAGLNRAYGLLTGKTPVTVKTLNTIGQDLANAFTQDGAATEGKIGRELAVTWQGYLNDLQLKGGSVKDVRKELPELTHNMLSLVQDAKGQYQQMMSDRAEQLHGAMSQSDNPKVQATIRGKLKSYAPDRFGKYYGAEGAPTPQNPEGGDASAQPSASDQAGGAPQISPLARRFQGMINTAKKPADKAALIKAAKGKLTPDELKAIGVQ